MRFKACDVLILSMYRHSECYQAELERLPRLSALNRLQRHTTAAKPCASDRQRSLSSPRKRPADPVDFKPSPIDMSGKRAVSLFSEPAHRRSTTGPGLRSGNLSQTPSLGTSRQLVLDSRFLLFRLPPTEQVPPKPTAGQSFPPSRMYRQGVQILQASRPSSDQPCQTLGLFLRNSTILSFLVDGAKAAVGVEQVWNQLLQKPSFRALFSSGFRS